MKKIKIQEFQTLGLFAVLAGLTIIIVFVFKVVLFAPRLEELTRKNILQIEIKNKSSN